MAKKQQQEEIVKINDVQVHCKYDELLVLDIFKPHPANPNKHPDNQIELLAKIMQKHGIRWPICVSKQTGFIISGHGRLQAAGFLNLEKYPVIYQDYESETEELAVLVNDNKISELATTDGLKLAEILVELDQVDYPMELTALNESQIQFFIEGPTNMDINKEWEGMPEFNQEDKQGFRSIIIHFPDQIAVNNFQQLLKQSITDKTKYLWFPKQEIAKVKDLEYADEK